ncbi:DUF2283 domain-containing protein (plasmid) [Cyanobacterium aponinum AL20118]|uniref:DUF2283 domain-containing protein n=1 Tax=Cyanobacterium aponinum AL20115 TaxID=3090662 RepID=A0AAF1C376_9CHRO|nr:DUF2283 domain-containing protein [Cyanobacterium aponinum]WPF90502.1 DUF2283 domain-containing protein [Cyanobacterium aponinum AL20115]
MIVTYDNEVDAIYFKLTENKIDSTEPQTDRIIIDYDESNNIVGIEVLDFNYLVKKGLTVADLPFSEDERLTASQYFNFPVAI